MTQTIAERVSFIQEAKRRLSDLEPDCEAWRDAQRIVVRARAGYWNAMGEEWDICHPQRLHPDEPDRRG